MRMAQSAKCFLYTVDFDSCPTAEWRQQHEFVKHDNNNNAHDDTTQMQPCQRNETICWAYTSAAYFHGR